MHVLTRWASWPRGIRWLVYGIAAVVLVLAVAWLLFVPVADWLAHHDVGSATGALHETALDNARGRLLTLGAGLVAAGALVFTALNFSLLRRNSQQADQWQRQANQWQQRTHELTEQGQVTDRYTKAVEQLGSVKIAVRIGGIYALERIARDSARDHPVVIEVLTEFIREHTPEQWGEAEKQEREQGKWMPADVQAALTVVGRRNAERDVRRIDLFCTGLANADLTGAQLARAQLSGVNLAGAFMQSTNLAGAILMKVNFTNATLRDVNLTGASLKHSDFTDASLSGVHFSGADLTEAKWPEGTPVPDGWKLDASTGRLRRAGVDPGPAQAD